LNDPAKILLLDIETAPNLSWIWARYEQDTLEVHTPWYILCFAYKWFGQKQIYTKALPDYPTYKKDKEDDRQLVTDLHALLDQADAVIGHNANRFDIKKSNARFISHNLLPPSPYQIIDTLSIARKAARFDSNKLDHLGEYLGFGRKLQTTGKHLWLACMRGDKAAWKQMREYNAQDIVLLERCYLRLRPWVTNNHPRFTWFTRNDGCPVCQSPKIESKGWRYTATGKRQRYVCNGCGHRFDAGKLIKNEAK
jgi:hypothetical protein